MLAAALTGPRCSSGALEFVRLQAAGCCRSMQSGNQRFCCDAGAAGPELKGVAAGRFLAHRVARGPGFSISIWRLLEGRAVQQVGRPDRTGTLRIKLDMFVTGQNQNDRSVLIRFACLGKRVESSGCLCGLHRVEIIVMLCHAAGRSGRRDVNRSRMGLSSRCRCPSEQNKRHRAQVASSKDVLELRRHPQQQSNGSPLQRRPALPNVRLKQSAFGMWSRFWALGGWRCFGLPPPPPSPAVHHATMRT